MSLHSSSKSVCVLNFHQHDQDQQVRSFDFGWQKQCDVLKFHSICHSSLSNNCCTTSGTYQLWSNGMFFGLVCVWYKCLALSACVIVTHADMGHALLSPSSLIILWKMCNSDCLWSLSLPQKRLSFSALKIPLIYITHNLYIQPNIPFFLTRLRFLLSLSVTGWFVVVLDSSKLDQKHGCWQTVWHLI